jgi:hypothetical protein
MIDPIELLKEARSLGSNATLARVQQVLASIDRTALEQAERARYRVEIWDEVSPLAGQPPEYWRNRGDWPAGGKVFLVYVDDRLVLVQPHDPEQAGLIPMDLPTAQARANALIARWVEQAVDAEVRRRALMQLL